MQLAKKIIRELKKAPERQFSVDQIFGKVSGRGVSRADVARSLRVLEEEGRLVHKAGAGYRLAAAKDALTGIFSASPRGHGSVSLPGADVHIPAGKTLGAMHGDTVAVSLSRRRGPGGSRTGSIAKVLTRANERVIGRFERHRRFGIVMPANDRITYEFNIPERYFSTADTGDIVEIEVTKWPADGRLPEGEILRVIGQDTAPGMDITMILLAHQWPDIFSDATITEAGKAPRTVGAKDIKGRKDLRDMFTVTIDGLDAKDFDDAISLEVDSHGHFQLGVHIADVSHYVTPGSALDADARERTTSVYLPDRVVPMLPHELSNGICSLNPLVDRLAFSVLMDIDQNGEVAKYEIVSSVIRSDARLTYEEVDRHLAKGFFKDPKLEHLLHALELLTGVLEKKRLARGSLNFETVEPKLILDEDGSPLEILIRERTPATSMIEETMILTNEAVAEFMLDRGAPMVYRVHDRPDPDAVFGITKLIDELGYPIGSLAEAHPRTFQALIDYAHRRPEKLLINSLMLRAMSRAKYSPSLIPHFGLAAPHYCHFTSPIRRYPDLLVHRLVKAVLGGRLESAPIVALIEELDELAEHCSRQEREAEAADREAVQMKIAEFMADKVGEEYPAVITGVTNFGLFVQLENTAEGLVHIRSLADDYYRFESERYLLRGERTGKIYRLGQPVHVRLTNVSVAQRQIDFIILPTPTSD
jgi:ribonuclease R